MTASDILTVILPSVFDINLPSSSLVKALPSNHHTLLFFSIGASFLKRPLAQKKLVEVLYFTKEFFININALSQKALQFNFTA